jgi:REP element-mobilizing transposase RayT
VIDFNAEGVVSHSPGLPRSGYPGMSPSPAPSQNPNGVSSAMPQSLSNILVHIVFSTKNREPFLKEADVRDEMHRMLGGISRGLDCPPVRIGGTADHVHLLARQARTISLADWVKELKRASSVWIKEREPLLALFHWQAGYGAFSVSQSQSPRVENYIERQEEHHRTITYQDELRELLRKHEVEFDERYVWD